MDDRAIKNLVQEQFGAAAQGYVASAGHARGGDLARLVELARPRGDERMLDIATGGGHTALAFAPHVREVVASDLTPRMLAAAEAFIRGQGVTNVLFEPADAEELPFADTSFDIVTARIAPHHFPNPRRFVHQAARVLRPGGLFLLDDNMAPEDAELDAFMNRFEQWRDPSHVRAYTVGEWRGWMADAGLTVEHVDPLTRNPQALRIRRLDGAYADARRRARRTGGVAARRAAALRRVLRDRRRGWACAVALRRVRGHRRTAG